MLCQKAAKTDEIPDTYAYYPLIPVKITENHHSGYIFQIQQLTPAE